MAVSEVRSSFPWLAFTGLVPVVLMVPILMAHAYAAGVVVAVVGCLSWCTARPAPGSRCWCWSWRWSSPVSAVAST